LSGGSILLTDDAGGNYAELVAAATLAGRERFGSAKNAIKQFCLESPLFREFAARAAAELNQKGADHAEDADRRPPRQPLRRGTARRPRVR
jgi:hypothetical protein